MARTSGSAKMPLIHEDSGHCGLADVAIREAPFVVEQMAKQGLNANEHPQATMLQKRAIARITGPDGTSFGRNRFPTGPSPVGLLPPSRSVGRHTSGTCP